MRCFAVGFARNDLCGAEHTDQVETVSETYRDASPLVAERVVHTISIDEMTGLQALERNAPSQPLRPDQPARDEYEYLRHGTPTLIGNLDVVTGELTTPTFGSTHMEEDILAYVQTTIASDPAHERAFVRTCLPSLAK